MITINHFLTNNKKGWKKDFTYGKYKVKRNSDGSYIVKHGNKRFPGKPMVGPEMAMAQIKQDEIKRAFSMKLSEGKTDFWKQHTEYVFRELGKNTYEVTKWGRGDTPSSIYHCRKGPKGFFCNCPSKRTPCIHIKELEKWLKAGKPSQFGKNPKKDVLTKLKRMGIKV